MSRSVHLGAIACAVLLASTTPTVLAQNDGASGQSANAAESIKRIVDSAQKFLATLDGESRTKVQFPFDSPNRQRWSNLPTGIYKREGLRLEDLTTEQRSAAMAVLSTAFSADGYRKIVNIVRGDEALRTRSGGRNLGAVRFGELEYFLTFIGAPSVRDPWMLQFGGHHLAINLTFVGTRATLAPSHTGSQPATFTFEGSTIRPLGDENDLAFALMASLSEAQGKKAILDYRLADLALGPGKDNQTIAPEGLRASELSSQQQEKLLDLVREWVGIANDAHAAARMDEIRATLPETYFAWSGPTAPGSAAYFRVQGPTLVIEYAPQRDTDHIHTIYRDPTNDYGAAFVRK
jgi:hypothetical protein